MEINFRSLIFQLGRPLTDRCGYKVRKVIVNVRYLEKNLKRD